MKNTALNTPLTLLGGLTPQQFLDEYWQKKPLLIRGAVPGFTGLLGREEIIEAAKRDDVESRFIAGSAEDWHLAYGPIAAKEFRRKGPWTVLVQGLNLFLPSADKLMRQFSFIPQARLDDVMVSYATDGGGVGPHFDNYDVFLLQGMGKRHWRISDSTDKTLIDGMPLRILQNFTQTEDWLLEPGDMLYLPPQYAHDGVAVGECMTYSMGFRTAPVLELVEGFLGYLQDMIADDGENQPTLQGRYADPELKLQANSAEISESMIEQVGEMLARIRWDKTMVRNFLGEFLTEPKNHVFFEPPEEPLSLKRFQTAVKKSGLRLDLRSQLLFSGEAFFFNGEQLDDFAYEDVPQLRELADQRRLPDLSGLSEEAVEWLYDAYCDGFLLISQE